MMPASLLLSTSSITPPSLLSSSLSSASAASPLLGWPSLLRSTTSSRNLLRKFCHVNSTNGTSSPATSLSLHNTESSDIRETHRLVVDQLKGHVFINQYLIIKDLGRGAQGTVKLCLNTQDDCLYAMKVIHKQRMRLKVVRPVPSLESTPQAAAAAAAGGQTFASRARRASFATRTGSGRRSFDPGVVDQRQEEIAIMKKLDHPNVVRLYEVVDDAENSKMLMVMEYVAGGAVVTGVDAEHVDPIPEREALQYFRDVVKGLEYLHFQQVVHLDIKPDNLLLDSDGQVKITDFGCATTCAPDEVIQGTLGTPSFLSPEACSGEPYDGFAADVWALGACLYMFVFGRAPFAGDTTLKLYDAIRSAPLHFPEGTSVSEGLRDLITRMLAKDAASRITLAEIKQHEWVTQVGDLASGEQQVMERIQVTGVEKRAAVTNPDSGVRLDSLQASIAVFEDGEHLLRQGEVGGVLYFIEEGTCEVYHVPHRLQAEKVVPDCDFADLLDDEDDDFEEGCPLQSVSGNAAFWSQLLMTNCNDGQRPSAPGLSREQSGRSLVSTSDAEQQVVNSAPNVLGSDLRMHSSPALCSIRSGYMSSVGLATTCNNAGQVSSWADGGPEGLTLVKRATSSLSVSMMRKGVLRSASMHKRMKKMVNTAVHRATARRPSLEMPVVELVALRGPGSIVGALRLPGRQHQHQQPSTTSVVAKGRVRALAFSQEQMEVLRTSPMLRASIVQAEAAAMVQDAVDSFAEFEEEIKELEELRMTVNDMSTQVQPLSNATAASSPSQNPSSAVGVDLVAMMDAC